MMAVSTAGLGLIAHVKNQRSFLILAVSLRFGQGVGDIIVQITTFSLITSIFYKDIMRYIGYLEIAAGVGLGMGPTIGSALFNFFDYEQTMIFFSGLLVLGFVVCWLFIPSILNHTISEEELKELKKQ